MLHEAGGSGALELGPDGEAQLPALPQVDAGKEPGGAAAGRGSTGGEASGGGGGGGGAGAAPRWAPEDVVASRSGDVLIKNTLLKADHFPGCQNLKLTPLLEGAPNFRQVEGLPVYGVAIPTTRGLRNVLDAIGARPCAPGGGGGAAEASAVPLAAAASSADPAAAALCGRRVLWHNMREEPVVYINGRPYVVREADQPFCNLEYTGIDRGRVEAMEARLKGDVLREAARYEGQILVTEEDDDMQVVDVWVPVTEADVQTPLELYAELASDGYDVDYARVPVTDEKAPKDRDFEALIQRLWGAPPGAALVFNCQMGRGRTTTGMIIASLLALRRACAFPVYSGGRASLPGGGGGGGGFGSAGAGGARPPAPQHPFAQLTAAAGGGGGGGVLGSSWPPPAGAAAMQQQHHHHDAGPPPSPMTRQHLAVAAAGGGGGAMMGSPGGGIGGGIGIVVPGVRAAGATAANPTNTAAANVPSWFVDALAAHGFSPAAMAAAAAAGGAGSALQGQQQQPRLSASGAVTPTAALTASAAAAAASAAASAAILGLPPNASQDAKLRAGYYGVVRSMLRVLERGNLGKAITDAVVDRCSAMQNLREAIHTYRGRLLSEPKERKRAVLLAVCLEYLERYCMLVAFAAYLTWGRFDPSSPGHVSFQAWTQSRPELRSVLQRMLRRNPMAALELSTVAWAGGGGGGAAVAGGAGGGGAGGGAAGSGGGAGAGMGVAGAAVERLRTQAEDDASRVAESRNGAVLGPMTILKEDYFPGMRSRRLPQRLAGASNFRAAAPGAVPGGRVYGVAMTTAAGIRNVLAAVRAEQAEDARRRRLEAREARRLAAARRSSGGGGVVGRDLAGAAAVLAAGAGAAGGALPGAGPLPSDDDGGDAMDADDEDDLTGAAALPTPPILWFNMREEPVVYVNGRPYVLREQAVPLKNLQEYAGITAARVERMEARLRDDVLAEAARYGGRILVARESVGASGGGAAGGVGVLMLQPQQQPGDAAAAEAAAAAAAVTSPTAPPSALTAALQEQQQRQAQQQQPNNNNNTSTILPTCELLDTWEPVEGPGAVQTTAELYEGLRACEGLGVRYYRVPVTDGRAPQPDDLDEIVARVREFGHDAPVVFNCQVGAGRTTTGMVVASLLHLRADAELRRAQRGGMAGPGGGFGLAPGSGAVLGGTGPLSEAGGAPSGGGTTALATPEQRRTLSGAPSFAGAQLLWGPGGGGVGGGGGGGGGTANGGGGASFIATMTPGGGLGIVAAGGGGVVGYLGTPGAGGGGGGGGGGAAGAGSGALWLNGGPASAAATGGGAAAPGAAIPLTAAELQAHRDAVLRAIEQEVAGGSPRSEDDDREVNHPFGRPSSGGGAGAGGGGGAGGASGADAAPAALPSPAAQRRRKRRADRVMGDSDDDEDDDDDDDDDDSSGSEEGAAGDQTTPNAANANAANATPTTAPPPAKRRAGAGGVRLAIWGGRAAWELSPEEVEEQRSLAMGGYVGVRRVARLLEHADAAKRAVDACVDAAGAMVNLRVSIMKYRRPRSSYANHKSEVRARHSAFARGAAYLERYCLLIAFAAYLEAEGFSSPNPRTGRPPPTFAQWLSGRPDLQTALAAIHANPAGALAAIPVVGLPAVVAQLADATLAGGAAGGGGVSVDGGAGAATAATAATALALTPGASRPLAPPTPAELLAVLSRRRGRTLTRRTILKSYTASAAPPEAHEHAARAIRAALEAGVAAGEGGGGGGGGGGAPPPALPAPFDPSSLPPPPAGVDVRAVDGLPIFTVGNVPVARLRELLVSMGAGAAAAAEGGGGGDGAAGPQRRPPVVVLLSDVREELVVYVNGVPHLRRDLEMPAAALHHAGIRARQLEALEAALRDDVRLEVARWGGRVLVHRELGRAEVAAGAARRAAAAVARRGEEEERQQQQQQQQRQGAGGTSGGGGGGGDGEVAASAAASAEADAALRQQLRQQKEDITAPVDQRPGLLVAALWEPVDMNPGGGSGGANANAASPFAQQQQQQQQSPAPQPQPRPPSFFLPVATCRDVAAQLAAEGFSVAYRRIPLSRERTPVASDLGDLYRQAAYGRSLAYPPPPASGGAAADDGGPAAALPPSRPIVLHLILSRTATGSSARFAAAALSVCLLQQHEEDEEAAFAEARRGAGAAAAGGNSARMATPPPPQQQQRPLRRTPSSLGEYRGIMSLGRLLPGGMEAKAAVDEAVDRCGAQVGNIRDDIRACKAALAGGGGWGGGGLAAAAVPAAAPDGAADTPEGESAAWAARQLGVHYLKRYFLLVTFRAFLQQQRRQQQEAAGRAAAGAGAGAGAGPSAAAAAAATAGAAAFVRWVEERSELSYLLNHQLTLDT